MDLIEQMIFRTIIIIILVMICLSLGYLFYNHSVQLQKQQEQYEELKDDYHHLNRRLLAREFPEMVRAHKRWKGEDKS